MIRSLCILTLSLLLVSLGLRIGASRWPQHGRRWLYPLTRLMKGDTPSIVRVCLRPLLLGALLVWAMACCPPNATLGTGQGFSHPVLMTLNIVTHGALVELLLSVAMLSDMAAWALWRFARLLNALHALRLAPSPSVLAAAHGLVPTDRLFLLADRRPQALCLGVLRPAVYVTTGLVERATPEALRAALAHEEAHRRRRDPLRFLLLRALTQGTRHASGVDSLPMRQALRAEVEADRFARTHTSLAALASALILVVEQGVSEVQAGPYSVVRRAEQVGASLLSTPSHAKGDLGDRAANLAIGDVGDERLRYLTLPCDFPLPALCPARPSPYALCLLLCAGLRWRLLILAPLLVAAIAPLLPATAPLHAALTCVFHR